MMLLRTSAGSAHPLFARTSASSEIPFLFTVGAFLCEIEGYFGRICSNVHQLAIKSSIRKPPIPLAYGSGRLHFIRVVTILQGRRFRIQETHQSCSLHRKPTTAKRISVSISPKIEEHPFADRSCLRLLASANETIQKCRYGTAMLEAGLKSKAALRNRET